MLYRVTAQVDGTIYLEENYSFRKADFAFDFQADSAGRLEKVAVSCRVPEEAIENYKMVLKEGSPESRPVLGFGVDGLTQQRLTRELQRVESSLAFISRGCLQRIRWNAATLEPITETPEEREVVTTPGHTIRQEYVTPNTLMSSEELELSAEMISPQLVAQQAFWSEGVRLFGEGAFVLAFYNFFFVIEDLFANGKTSQKEVLKAFSRSKTFRSICDATLKIVLRHNRLGPALQKSLVAEECEESVEGLQMLLFRLRGQLHHYFSKSPKTTATPFNQRPFEAIAFTALEVSGQAIANERERSNAQG